MIRMEVARSDATRRQILELQRENLAERLSPAEAAEQGFVTVRHDLGLLERIAGPHGHVVAMDGDRVVGYALVMLKEFASAVPILVPMFERIERLPIGGRPYFVMGQVCVAKERRGQGLFRSLYEELRRHMRGAYDIVVTEVAARNTRSLRAHEKVGFRPVLRYEDGGETWEIVVWNWDRADLAPVVS